MSAPTAGPVPQALVHVLRAALDCVPAKKRIAALSAMECAADTLRSEGAARFNVYAIRGGARPEGQLTPQGLALMEAAELLTDAVDRLYRDGRG